MATTCIPSYQLPVQVKGQDAAVITHIAVKQDDMTQEEQIAQVRHFMNADTIKGIEKFSERFVNDTIMEAVAKYQDDQVKMRKNLKQEETRTGEQEGRVEVKQEETRTGEQEGRVEGRDGDDKQEVELDESTRFENNVITKVKADSTAEQAIGDKAGGLREVKVIIEDRGAQQESCTDGDVKVNTGHVLPIDISKSDNSLDDKWPFLTQILPEYTYKLLPKVKILSTFIPTCTNMIYAVCPIGDGGAWISYNYSGMVTLVDSHGTVHQVISHSTAITDISVAPRIHDILTSAQGQYPWISPQGQTFLTVSEIQQPLTPEKEEFWTTSKKNRYSWAIPNTTHEQHLWICSGESQSVWECCTCTSSEKPVLRFKTDISPRSLCATMDGHIIVGMEQVLTKFTKEGKPLFSTKDFQVGNQSLVYSPRKITECPVTQNIAVLDRSWSDREQHYKNYVLVMDLEFQEVFRYNGQGVTQNLKQSFKRGLHQFDPIDVKYDSIGNLVIGDRQGHNLHLFLINGEGQLTHVLYTDNLPTHAIGIDRKNVLWAAFSDYTNKHIKLLQYSE